MLNFAVRFKTITGAQRVVMSQDEILKDDQLFAFAQKIIDSDSLITGFKFDTQAYGVVSISDERFDSEYVNPNKEINEDDEE